MRATAGNALCKMDTQAKYRRALLRAPVAASNVEFVPGTQVYFWTPSVKRRGRGDALRWREQPAVRKRLLQEPLARRPQS